MKLNSVEFVTSVAHVDQLTNKTIPEIAFAGRSNVGKSSLINCLLNRKKMAKISSTPGKTRLLNYFILNEKLYFVDLPGYGFARVPPSERKKWRQLIEGYMTTSNMLKVTLILTDLRHPLSKLDVEMITWVSHMDLPHLVIGTKADKLSRNQLHIQLAKNKRQLKEIGSDAELMPFSSVTKVGRKELWQKMSEFVR